VYAAVIPRTRDRFRGLPGLLPPGRPPLALSPPSFAVAAAAAVAAAVARPEI
jgi:hypothetical protein